RRTETQKLFDSIIMEDAPLTIIDRYLELRDPRYQFPSKYIPYITPPVRHDFLMKLHKIFRWSINMNSVKYSETMFANRVRSEEHTSELQSRFDLVCRLLLDK